MIKSALLWLILPHWLDPVSLAEAVTQSSVCLGPVAKWGHELFQSSAHSDPAGTQDGLSPSCSTVITSLLVFIYNNSLAAGLQICHKYMIKHSIFGKFQHYGSIFFIKPSVGLISWPPNLIGISNSFSKCSRNCPESEGIVIFKNCLGEWLYLGIPAWIFSQWHSIVLEWAPFFEFTKLLLWFTVSYLKRLLSVW